MMHRPLPDDWPSHGNLVAEFMEDMWIFWGRNGSMRKKDLFLTTQNWKRIVATCSFSQGKPSKRRFFKA